MKTVDPLKSSLVINYFLASFFNNLPQNYLTVSSGSVSVNEDSSVQVLAEELAEISDLDAAAIRDGFSQATQQLQSATSEAAKAEAQIAVECYEALQKALE